MSRLPTPVLGRWPGGAPYASPAHSARHAVGLRPMTFVDCMRGTLNEHQTQGIPLSARSADTVAYFCNPANLGGEAELSCWARLLQAHGFSGSEVASALNFCRNSRMARMRYGDGQFLPPNW
ncbi:MAG TPA: hypothetical protein VF158_17150 [Longimicrobiales bacterium]